MSLGVYPMKKVVLCLVLPIALAACSNPIKRLPADLQGQKPACAGGDFSTCSEIGHSVRDASGGTTVQPKTYNISEPIID